MEENQHIPVLIGKISEYIQEGDTRIVDATTGLGGYIKTIAKINPETEFLGLDCDEKNLSIAKQNLKDYRVTFHKGNFSEIQEVLTKHNFKNADVFLFDLGLCSTHIDNPHRGFSFSKEGPLDMRFSGEGPSAYDLINFKSQEEIENILKEYGEESLARDIAKNILKQRKAQKITSTQQLARIIEKTYEERGRKRGKIHPATRTFQALRIWVNEELDVLQKALKDTIACMKPGAKIFVVSYHSLEDRIVKNIFRNKKKEGVLTLINKKVIVPDEEEIRNNPRARSAKLRIAQKNA